MPSTPLLFSIFGFPGASCSASLLSRLLLTLLLFFLFFFPLFTDLPFTSVLHESQQMCPKLIERHGSNHWARWIVSRRVADRRVPSTRFRHRAHPLEDATCNRFASPSCARRRARTRISPDRSPFYLDGTAVTAQISNMRRYEFAPVALCDPLELETDFRRRYRPRIPKRLETTPPPPRTRRPSPSRSAPSPAKPCSSSSCWAARCLRKSRETPSLKSQSGTSHTLPIISTKSFLRERVIRRDAAEAREPPPQIVVLDPNRAPTPSAAPPPECRAT